MTTKIHRPKSPEAQRKEAIEKQKRQRKRLYKEIERRMLIPEALVEPIEIRTKEALVEALKTMPKYASATSIMNFMQDYTNEMSGIQFILTYLERVETPEEKESAKARLLAALKNEFKTYRMFWDDLIESYNKEQENMYRKKQIPKPKIIGPRAMHRVVFNEKDQDATKLQRISYNIKAHYTMPHLLDDLDLIKSLIAQAHSLVFG